MIVREMLIKDEDKILIEFNHHRKAIYTAKIPATFDKSPNLKRAKAKREVIKEFLQTFEGRKYTEREVIKAYSKVDKYFADLYKEMFPNGGKRKGAGRPVGTKKSTGKTACFTRAITAEEKEFLEDCLKRYRFVAEHNPDALDELRQRMSLTAKHQKNSEGLKSEKMQDRAKFERTNPTEYQELIRDFNWGE